MDTPITLVAHIRAAPGKADELAALLSEQAGVIRRTEPGCLCYRLHRSTDDPDVFVFYETYANQAAVEAHHASPHIAVYRKRRLDAGLTAGPVVIENMTALTE